MNKIVVLLGKTASGKNTIFERIIKDFDIKPIVSYTTRPIRVDKEIQGIDYNFVSDEEFKKGLMNNEFLEFRSYNTFESEKETIWYYGTHKSSIDFTKGSYIHIVDKDGLMQLLDIYGKEKIFSIYIDADLNDIITRSLKRDDTNIHELVRRIIDDQAQHKHSSFFCDRTVKNEDITQCYNTVANILELQGFKKKDN